MREKTIKGIAAVNKGEKLVMGVIFMALTAVIFVQILTRWLGLKSFSWLEEVAQSTYLCVVFAGTSICISEKGLSRVSIYQNLPAPIVWIIDLAMNLLSIVVAGYCVRLSYSIFTQMLKLGMKTSVLSIPLYLLYGFITVVFACMTVRFVIKTLLQVTERKVEKDPEKE
nr:TRAP transporter small permease subunit [uncultured Oscillibacter sp.]